MHFSLTDIDSLSHKFRLNLINSITGIKPANLVGTNSNEFGNNLAIISSIVHLGSNPPLIGFIMRPTVDVPRNTYTNIQENGYYTINHIHEGMIEQSHYTSAKFEHGISEFEKCKLTEEIKDDFPAPYVKESHLKIGLRHVETIEIKSNKTLMLVGEIQHIYLPDENIDERGYLRLDKMNNVGIGGLNSYYQLKKIAEFPYARPNELPF